MSKLKRLAYGPLDGFSKEQLLEAIVIKTIRETLEDNDVQMTTRDIMSTADGVMDVERDYLRELRDDIEKNILAGAIEDKDEK
jgi:hypothetical protein